MIRYVMGLGKLAQAKQKRQERFKNEFISLYDSVLYLGEPLNEALEYIIEIAPSQSKLYLTNDGCEVIGYDTDLYGTRHNAIWTFGEYELCNDEIIKILTECIKQKHIDQNSPIYNLGFGKKRFLSYLQSDGIEIDPKDLENAISPTPVFDEYLDFDHYTIQSIIDERDELREKLSNQTTVQQSKDELATKSKNAIAKIILALLEMNELDWKNADPYDYTSPNGINNLIFSQLQALDLGLTNRYIGDWIKLAQEQV